MFFCKGSFVNGVTNHIVNLKKGVIIVKNVPCMQCEQCGESFYSDNVAMQLEKIVAIIDTANIAEVAIVDFTNKVA